MERLDQQTLPIELVSICKKAMAWKKQDRYATVQDLEEDLNAWLDGLKAKERGLALVQLAEETKEKEQSLLQRVAVLRAEVDVLRAEVPSSAMEEEKLPLWNKEDEAE